jgi:hypothetical protein
MIQSAGMEAGLHFDSPPLIRISANAEIEPHEILIQAQISRQQIGDTSTLAIPEEINELGNQAGVPEVAFLIVQGDQVYPLTYSYINIGRRPDNHIVLDDRRVSRVHAQLRLKKGRFAKNSPGSSYERNNPAISPPGACACPV